MCHKRKTTNPSLPLPLKQGAVQVDFSISAEDIHQFSYPSGLLAASEADRRITNQIRDAGKVLEIPLLDHIILTAEGHLSFADEGYL